MAPRAWGICVLVVAAIWSVGCGDTPVPVDGDADGDADGDVDGDADGDVDGDADGDVDGDGLAEIVILHTSDEHGWLEPRSSDEGLVGGAAAVAGWWREHEEGSDEARLILSSGDNWTGPTISTCLDGESVVDVMSQMGYDASVFGNHEVDFGRDAMHQRFAEADFPYLAANLRDAASGELWSEVSDVVIREIDGVTVAVIGLASPDTPDIVFGEYVEDLQFGPAFETLERVVPQVRGEGAEVVVVAAHMAPGELGAIPPVSGGVDVYLGGHLHSVEAFEAMGSGALIVGSGDNWRGYSRVVVTVDRETGTVLSREAEFVEVAAGPEAPVDSAVEAAVETWAEAAGVCEGEVIGHTVSGLDGGSWAIANWVTDSWLASERLPPADVALTNSGGMRAGLEPGEITEGDIMTILPFDNEIFMVELTGLELREQIRQGHEHCLGGPCYVAAGGIFYEWLGFEVDVVFADGRELSDDVLYTVLVNDYMYAGNAGFTLAEADPEPYGTGLSYRDPVVEHTRRLDTSEEDPLELSVDPLWRDRLWHAEPIGYTETGIARASWTMSNWVTDGWLVALPEADFAISNSGGLSAHVPRGVVRVGHVVAMMPYDNDLVEVETTGAAIAANLELFLSSCTDCYASVSGFTYDASTGAVTLAWPDGTPVDLDATYTMVTTDYLYETIEPDGDPPAVDTGIHWRAPVIEWTGALGSSESAPLESSLDSTARGWL